MPWICIGECWYSATIFYLGSRWSWVVSFMPRTYCPQRKKLRHLLDRRLVGPQSRSAKSVVCICRESNSGPLTPYPVAIPTELFQLVNFWDWTIHYLVSSLSRLFLGTRRWTTATVRARIIIHSRDVQINSIMQCNHYKFCLDEGVFENWGC
jgi:hypothetical protein